MRGARAVRTTVAVVVIGAFGLYVCAIVFGWPLPEWMPVVALIVALLAVVVLSLMSRRLRRGSGSGELYASDPYSDIELGRRRPTHPHHDPSESSEIVQPPPQDPLRLPDEPPRGQGDRP